MKRLLFAAAMAISIPAMAQDMGQPASPPTDTAAPPAAPNNGMMKPMPDATTAPADSTMPATQPDTAAGAMTTQTDAGATAAPADPAAPAPADAAMSNTMAAAPAAGDSSSYPVCSKSVTDRCINRSASVKTRKRGG